METFFKTIRSAMGLSQKEIADRMGITRGAYIKLEKGKTRVITESVLAFCDVTGVKLTDLIAECYPDRCGGILHEDEHLREQFDSMRNEYEDRLERKNQEIASKDALIASHQHTIRIQEQMLGMLQRNSGEKD